MWMLPFHAKHALALTVHSRISAAINIATFIASDQSAEWPRQKKPFRPYLNHIWHRSWNKRSCITEVQVKIASSDAAGTVEAGVAKLLPSQ